MDIEALADLMDEKVVQGRPSCHTVTDFCAGRYWTIVSDFEVSHGPRELYKIEG